MRQITVGPNDAGQRLDKFVGKAVRGLPASMLYKLIRLKKIKVNRKRAQPNQMMQVGDEIQLFIKEEFFDAPAKDRSALGAIRPKLDVVYEDDHILLLNKRPGVLVHEDTEGVENTLLLHIQAYLYQKGEYHPDREASFAPALCNRIDRNTGGIVIAAKDAEALREMNRRIRENQVQKYYLCLAHGAMPKPQETLKGYLKKDEVRRRVSVQDAPCPGAKTIVTQYRVLRQLPDPTCRGGTVSLLEVALITGRTHQIRAHLAHMGHPLVGDGKYGVNRGDRMEGYKHQALYAWRLRFDFPDDGGVLHALKGREVRLDPSSIWFLRDAGVDGVEPGVLE